MSCEIFPYTVEVELRHSDRLSCWLKHPDDEKLPRVGIFDEPLVRNLATNVTCDSQTVEMRLQPFNQPGQPILIHVWIFFRMEQMAIVDAPKESRHFGVLAYNLAQYRNSHQFRLIDPPRMRFDALA